MTGSFPVLFEAISFILRSIMKGLNGWLSDLPCGFGTVPEQTLHRHVLCGVWEEYRQWLSPSLSCITEERIVCLKIALWSRMRSLNFCRIRYHLSVSLSSYSLIGVCKIQPQRSQVPLYTERLHLCPPKTPVPSEFSSVDLPTDFCLVTLPPLESPPPACHLLPFHQVTCRINQSLGSNHGQLQSTLYGALLCCSLHSSLKVSLSDVESQLWSW